MIHKKTTLILGAGASSHVGYPLGAGLLNDLCNIRVHNKYPALPEKWSKEEVDDLLIDLSRSGHYSIDAFLEFSERRDLGKYLISCKLKEYEDIDKLYPPHNSGWYQTLFAALINECGADIGKNNISIVTFNYDRSLETYLHQTLMHRFKLNDGDAWKHVSGIPIVHVHGILGDYPTTQYQKTDKVDVDELLYISDKIKIIHEFEDNESGFCNSEFEQANKFLQDSERIVFLGFGFHEDNIRRFKFFTPATLSSREIHTTSSGITAFEYNQMLDRLEKYGFKEALEPINHHTCDAFFRHNITL